MCDNFLFSKSSQSWPAWKTTSDKIFFISSSSIVDVVATKLFQWVLWSGGMVFIHPLSHTMMRQNDDLQWKCLARKNFWYGVNYKSFIVFKAFSCESFTYALVWDEEIEMGRLHVHSYGINNIRRALRLHWHEFRVGVG